MPQKLNLSYLFYIKLFVYIIKNKNLDTFNLFGL